MKIAFLNIYSGIIDRGSEVFTQELAQQLSQKHEVTVFQTGIKTSSTFKTVRIGNIPLLKTQNILYDIAVLVFTLRTLPMLLQHRYDWIIPLNGRFQAIICRIVRFISKSKILISGHAGVGREDKINIMIGKPDIFIALSPIALAWAKKFRQKTVYCPNGVNLAEFNPKIKPAELNLEKPIIFCNAAFLPYKRIELLIRAVSKLNKASLLLVGDGPLKQKIKKLGNELLGDRIAILHHVSRSDMPKFYTASDLFSLPSMDSEAFGLVYLEAMASNVPIVAPDDENRKTIIGSAGLYCDPEDTAAYTRTLNEALTKEWKNIPANQARKFSWANIAECYEHAMTTAVP